MKNSLIFYFLISFISYLPANAAICSSQHHGLDTSFKSMYGTWIWINGKDTLTLFLREDKESTQKANVHSSGQSLFAGWHKFIRNRTIVEDTYNAIEADTVSGMNTHASIFGYLKGKNECIITQFADSGGDFVLSGRLRLISGEADKAILQIEPKRDLRIVTKTRDTLLRSTSIHTNIVLKKVLD